jgi:hypothetical protein
VDFVFRHRGFLPRETAQVQASETEQSKGAMTAWLDNTFGLPANDGTKLPVLTLCAVGDRHLLQIRIRVALPFVNF